MGFGYNPDLIFLGDRLDILYYFSWMKKIQEVKEWFIWDASSYYIVNVIPKKKIEKLNGALTGEKVLEILVNEQEKPKRREISRNCDLRSTILKRIIDNLGINTTYRDARQVFREITDKRYSEALDLALAYVERIKKERPELVKEIFPPTDNPASQLYLPLEIAEALYLSEVYGISSKFGPQTEEFFDECILDLQNQRNAPYQTIWCPSGPRRAGYLSDKGVIWASSSEQGICTLFENDPAYKKFVEGYIKPFQKDGENTIDCIKRFQNILRGDIK